MHIREAFGINPKHFKPLKDSEQMMAEGREKIRRIQEKLTHEDVVAALKDTVIQRVTPLAHLDYPS